MLFRSLASKLVSQYTKLYSWAFYFTDLNLIRAAYLFSPHYLPSSIENTTWNKSTEHGCEIWNDRKFILSFVYPNNVFLIVIENFAFDRWHPQRRDIWITMLDSESETCEIVCTFTWNINTLVCVKILLDISTIVVQKGTELKL